MNIIDSDPNSDEETRGYMAKAKAAFAEQAAELTDLLIRFGLGVDTSSDFERGSFRVDMYTGEMRRMLEILRTHEANLPPEPDAAGPDFTKETLVEMLQAMDGIADAVSNLDVSMRQMLNIQRALLNPVGRDV